MRRRTVRGVPDFGSVIPRAKLLKTFESFRPHVTFLVAPGGYGKSVVAAQLARSAGFETCIWVNLQAAELSGEEAASSVIRRMHGLREEPACLLLDAQDEWAAMDASECFQDYAGKCICIVLDNATRIHGTQALSELQTVLAQTTCTGSRVIVTAREVEFSCSDDPEIWSVGTDELRLSSAEAQLIVRQIAHLELGESKVTQLLDECSGQVALFCVLLRHPVLPGFSKISCDTDLKSYIRHLAQSQLDGIQQKVLYAASLLGTATQVNILRIAGADDAWSALCAVSQKIPLVRLSRSKGDRVCSVHEIAVEVFSAPEFSKIVGDASDQIQEAALQHLQRAQDYERLYRVLLRRPDSASLTVWAERCGFGLIHQGHADLLADVYDRIPQEDLITHPKLLLIKALMLRQTQEFDEALRLAGIAARICEHEAEYSVLSVETAIIMSRVYMDQGRYDLVADCLEKHLDDSLATSEPSLYCQMLGYLVAARAYLGHAEEALLLSKKVQELIASGNASSEAKGSTLMFCAGILSLVLGNAADSGQMMADVANDAAMPLSYRIQAQGNLAETMCERGRCTAGLEVIDKASARCQSAGQFVLAACHEGTRGALLAGLGKTLKSTQAMRRALEVSESSGDLYMNFLERLSLTCMYRAFGRFDESLAEVERAKQAVAARRGFPVDEGWVLVETAASLLAIGDCIQAEAQANRALELLEPLGAKQYVLRAHLVLAEKKRLEKQISAAVEEVRAQADYIVSENGNWGLAMYIRAFPGLLGVVATAVGVEHLPAHMLHMILPENAKTALSMAYDELAESPWRALARRLLGREEAVALELELKNRPLVRVRLFGGLEVATPEGVVSESKWKKRKARLVLAMLVVRQGQDVPRDMLLDHLWPGMREPQAKNNFYVVWSLMRRALMPDGAQPASCPYVECTGGVCRVVRPLVWSDLDEFDTVLARLDAAEKSDDVDAGLMIARRLHTIYRAELLPSELYDDWFGPTRARYRTLLGDAMLRVSRMCYKAQDPETGSQVVRYGLEHDPWREDLYQAALRYQIDAGQRSMAIETYITCRTRLAEDLGIDPSPETQRLYEEAIAMEEDEPEEK